MYIINNHTHVTLPYLTLPYLTLHYITTHNITLHYTWHTRVDVLSFFTFSQIILQQTFENSGPPKPGHPGILPSLAPRMRIPFIWQLESWGLDLGVDLQWYWIEDDGFLPFTPTKWVSETTTNSFFGWEIKTTNSNLGKNCDYPPGNGYIHIPPTEKENHRLKSAGWEKDMLVPGRVIHFGLFEFENPAVNF